MCDRFSLALPKEKIARRFNVKITQALEANYNISPGTIIAVIADNKPDHLQTATWGMLMNEGSKINKPKQTHTLHTSVLQHPKQTALMQLLQTQRCLIPADGFYVWKKVSRKGKVPYRVALKWNLPFAFAAIWNYENQASGYAYTCAILTTASNDTLRPLYQTMPVILPIESEKLWLNHNTPTEAILQMLRSYPGEQMNFFSVSTKINSPTFNSPLLLEASQPIDQFGNYMMFD